MTPVPQIDGSAERVTQYVGEYRRNNFGGSYTTVEKLGRLLSSTTNRQISDPGDGTLEVRSGIFGTARFAERDVDFFQELGGHETVVFRRNANGRVNGAVFGSEPVYTFELVSLVESVLFNAVLLSFSLVAFTSALLIAAISLIRSLLGRAPLARHDLAAVARLIGGRLSHGQPGVPARFGSSSRRFRPCYG